MEIYTYANVCCVHVEIYMNVGVQKVHGRNVALVSHVDHIKCVCVCMRMQICMCLYPFMCVFVRIWKFIQVHMFACRNLYKCGCLKSLRQKCCVRVPCWSHPFVSVCVCKNSFINMCTFGNSYKCICNNSRLWVYRKATPKMLKMWPVLMTFFFLCMYVCVYTNSDTNMCVHTQIYINVYVCIQKFV